MGQEKEKNQVKYCPPSSQKLKKNNNYYVFSVRTPDSVPLKYTSRGDGHLREHSDQWRNNKQQQPTGEILLKAGWVCAWLGINMCWKRGDSAMDFSRRKRIVYDSEMMCRTTWKLGNDQDKRKNTNMHWKYQKMFWLAGFFFQTSLTPYSTVPRLSKHLQSLPEQRFWEDKWNGALSG